MFARYSIAALATTATALYITNRKNWWSILDAKFQLLRAYSWCEIQSKRALSYFVTKQSCIDCEFYLDDGSIFHELYHFPASWKTECPEKIIKQCPFDMSACRQLTFYDNSVEPIPIISYGNGNEVDRIINYTLSSNRFWSFKVTDPDGNKHIVDLQQTYNYMVVGNVINSKTLQNLFVVCKNIHPISITFMDKTMKTYIIPAETGIQITATGWEAIAKFA